MTILDQSFRKHFTLPLDFFSGYGKNAKASSWELTEVSLSEFLRRFLFVSIPGLFVSLFFFFFFPFPFFNYLFVA